MLVRLGSCFGYCNDESLVNEQDLQMGEQLTELCNKYSELAHHDSVNLNGLGLYQDYRDIITSPKRAQQKHEILNFSPDAMLKYLSSMGLEEYRSLVIFLQIMLSWSVSVASYEHSISRIKLMRIQ
jgi:hypothetical protein